MGEPTPLQFGESALGSGYNEEFGVAFPDVEAERQAKQGRDAAAGRRCEAGDPCLFALRHANLLQLRQHAS